MSPTVASVPARGTKWLIRQVAPRSFEVLRDRRVQRTLGSEDEALAFIRTHRQPTDRVYREAEDGYREDITREVGRAKRRHWRENLR